MKSLRFAVVAAFGMFLLAAGSVQAGYGMRAQAIRWVEPQHPGVNLEAGLEAMVEKGWLKKNPSGTWFYLTPDGAEQVKGLMPGRG